MKLLICTQKVDINDDNLGFFHDWIQEFSKHCEEVTVICLKKGLYELPKNVKVISLGKESGGNRLLYILRFYKYIFRERKNYDSIFVHMNPEYVVLAGLYWRLIGKKIGLWYAHGHIPLTLVFAEKITNFIFSSTDMGCRLKSNKKKIVGQGIKVEKFVHQTIEYKPQEIKIVRILSVGRISPSKDYETLINAVEVLKNKGRIKYSVEIVGGPGTFEQKEYLLRLKEIVREKNLDNIIKFIGSIPSNEIYKYYSADLFVNCSHTGSLDKAGLEAMACEIPVLTCNEAYKDILKDNLNIFLFPKGDYKKLSRKIEEIIRIDHKQMKELTYELRNLVVINHSLKKLIESIVSYL